MKNLLLVDDELLMLTSLSEALKFYDRNLNILTAKNGEQAMKILGSSKVDLLITDLYMPVKSGFELLDHMTKKRYDTPVIVMTASGEEAFRMVNSRNVRNFIAKPFNFENLVEMIHDALRSKPENQEDNGPFL